MTDEKVRQVLNKKNVSPDEIDAVLNDLYNDEADKEEEKEDDNED